jgi:TIR domain-containing protein
MIGLTIEPGTVESGVARVVTVRLTNTDNRPLTNIVVGLDIPPEMGLEQGRTSFDLPRLAPGAAYEHALRIRPSPPGHHAIAVRNLSCRNGDGRTYRERHRRVEITVEEAVAVPVSVAPGLPAPPPPRRRSVFVSYRRHDTKLMVPGLVRDLGRRKALRQVDLFLDLTDIPPGTEWPRVLDAELRTCDVLVAIIGPTWLTPRLREPGDVVRREIGTALNRGAPVVPLIVDTRMPASTDLAPDLQSLTRWQAFVFDLAAYSASVAKLSTTLGDLLAAPAAHRSDNT